MRLPTRVLCAFVLSQGFLGEILARMASLGWADFRASWGADAAVVAVSILGARSQPLPLRLLCFRVTRFSDPGGPTRTHTQMAAPKRVRVSAGALRISRPLSLSPRLRALASILLPAAEMARRAPSTHPSPPLPHAAWAQSPSSALPAQVAAMTCLGLLLMYFYVVLGMELFATDNTGPRRAETNHGARRRRLLLSRPAPGAQRPPPFLHR